MTMKKAYVLLAVALIIFIWGCDKGGRDSDPISTPSLSDEKSITSFSLNHIAGTINQRTKTIDVTVPFGTDVTAMVATFTSTGVRVNVGSTDQISGTTANDFTHPVIYTVTAADTTTQNYTVTVTVEASPAAAKSITSFSLNGYTGTINEAQKTISVTVPNGTSLTNLVATFTTSGINVNVGGTEQISGTTENDFTNPVVYTVVAADATTQDYTVTVKEGTPLPSYSISGKVSGAVLSGVKIALSGDGSAETTTDSSGNYKLDNVPNGNYILTPSLSGYAFSPSSLSITINNANVTKKNFTAVFDYTGHYTGTLSIGTYSGGVIMDINAYTETSMSATLSIASLQWSLSKGYIKGTHFHAEGSNAGNSTSIIADGTFSSDGLTLSGTCSASDGTTGTFSVAKQ